jgi:hypothetical protein
VHNGAVAILILHDTDTTQEGNDMTTQEWIKRLERDATIQAQRALHSESQRDFQFYLSKVIQLQDAIAQLQKTL